MYNINNASAMVYAAKQQELESKVFIISFIVGSIIGLIIRKRRAC